MSFESKATNPIRHQRYFDEFDCSCVPDERSGRRWEATIRLRDVECPVHCPDTSKVVRRRLEELARRLRRMTGSAGELYRAQSATTAMTRAALMETMAMTAARVRKSEEAEPVEASSSKPVPDPLPETSTQIAFVEVD